uniref:restriction endonuclease n=1 Tax=Shewanella putrefaciens TaxID=24 RepID=UPI00046A8B2D|nr:restriction endonuclease [Shewanella putrefaciens]
MNIDFSKISGEDFEFLVAELLLEEGLTIESRPAIGPDAGKDLLVIRNSTCSLGYPSVERILVECKHTKANVSESDLGYYERKMEKHKANRYLLVTTSSVTESVRNHFEATNNSETDKKAIYWTKNDLKSIYLKA